MNKFQIVLTGLFGFFIVAAVLTFALYRGGNSQEAYVTLWGTLSSQEFSLFYNNSPLASDGLLHITYVEKPAGRIEADFTEALAQGAGPDLILLRQDQLQKNKSKLVPIPYSNISQREFQETFAEAGDVYLGTDGVYGLPVLIDPLVLYYNRDLLSTAGIAKPLQFWDEIYGSVSNLSRHDNAGNLTKSAIAMGETRNIANAKDIFSLLLIQAGSPITAWNGRALRSSLSESFGLPVLPAESALEFFTQFSNPTKSYYSWNRALPEAQTRFTSGDLAYYIGFASEYRAIKNKNPLLNFSVASVPQSRVSGRSVTTGKVYGLSVSRGTRDASAAYAAMVKLIAPQPLAQLAETFALPPARRDLLSLKPTDSVWPVFYNAALQTKSWADPDAAGTKAIFADMIETVTSGRGRVSQAVSKANEELNKLIAP